MTRFLMPKPLSELSFHFLCQRVKSLSPYHVMKEVTFLHRFQNIGCNMCVGRIQTLSTSSQNAPFVSMDEPFMKKYVSDILDGNPKDKHRRNSLHLDTLRKLVYQRELLSKNIVSLNELKQEEGNDKELQRLAEEEQSTYQNELFALDSEILKTLVPRNIHETYSEILVEISSGAGGQEAMLFANELFQMYANYAILKNWTFFVETLEKTEIGGLQFASIFIQGDGAFYYMQNEIGVHRVQRVPVTSTAGMIHTSTAAVIVMPQPTEVDIKIDNKDLVYETMKASGPGGQNVNKTESAIRLKHLPSGIVVECQEQKHQHRNREVALRKLRSKLYDIEIQKQNKEISSTRNSQLGNRERSAKIRTYNFPQNRVTDHRGHLTTHNIRDFMLGGTAYNDFLEKLNEENEKQLILQFISELRGKQ